ncbi:MAG TPA: riboflavin synthase [Nevskiaceae bacterium]|nr:riboflavin synthase [Nevskiaceae bacterium]
MFTGIIEATGTLQQVAETGGDRRMTFVCAGPLLGAVKLGDSIAVNGVCLTATQHVAQGFVADLSAETLAATTAGAWRTGMAVNLELALTPAKPLGGHFVSGHVDGVGQLIEKHEDARSWRYTFEAPAALARYIARKGSITIDGVSLTVNEVSGRQFGVNIIPHTLQATTLGTLVAGAQVNLEVDLVARYLERLLAAREEGT